ncbi:MAG: DUF2490 domain-containing protein [Bacteroidaceae bacterium]|nr:DUF2490 domain-containing protein [Bacteroidaceae bacterium]
MKKIRCISLLALLMPMMAWAEGSDDFGVWAEMSVEKSINKKWSVGMETEFRAQEKDRWSIGTGLEYKPMKHLKLGASYNFLYAYRPDKITKQVFDEDNELESFRYTHSYWSPRHRFSVEATGTTKLWNWLRISVRERYQLTHRTEKNVDREDIEMDAKYTEQGLINDTVYSTKTIAPNTDQVLRSRLKFEYDRKGCAFSPFVYAEAHNSVAIGDNMLLEKVRLGIGSGYKINKKNELTLAYVLTFNIHDDDENYTRIHERMHVVNIGYKYKF